MIVVNQGGAAGKGGHGGKAGAASSGASGASGQGGQGVPGGAGGAVAAGGAAGAGKGGAGGQGGVSGGQGGVSGAAGAGGASQPLPCDKRFSFSKNPIKAGEPFQATVTDPQPFPWIELQVAGPGAPAVSDQVIAGQGPYQWTWTVKGHEAGVLALKFFRDKMPGTAGVVEATCQVQVQPGSGGQGGQGGGGQAGGGGQGAGGSGPPTENRYGIGLVEPGSASDFDLAAKLAGPGGHVLVIFADMTPGRHDADPGWKESISQAYARDLIPVVRLAPPWDNRNVRAMGESPTSYKGLAQAYKDVVASLPRREGWPLYLAAHNEPNLCYEWVCKGGGWITEDQMASEYAHYLADVADAIHELGDPRLKVTLGALAPGGVTKCQCDGDGYEGGTTALTFLQKMKEAVPGVFDKLDVWASHSYPAKGEGFGFFCPLPDAYTGLKFFEKELATIGKPDLKVLVTETGWSIDGDAGSGCPPQSREQVASFTVDAYQNVWETHPSILGVTPFMLRSSSWERFAWTQVDGTPYPVYSAVRAHRCGKPGAQNCQ